MRSFNIQSLTLQPVSMLAGAALAVAAFLSLAHQPAPAGSSYRYEIFVDLEQDQIGEMTKDGWEYVGYLGQSKKGSSSDETLWRRPE